MGVRQKKPRRDQWVSTAIRKALAEKIRRRVLGNGDYPSITAFINDAVRRRLEELESKAVPILTSQREVASG